MWTFRIAAQHPCIHHLYNRVGISNPNSAEMELASAAGSAAESSVGGRTAMC